MTDVKEETCACRFGADGKETKMCKFHILLTESLIKAEKERDRYKAVPIPMLLWCPACHAQHVDRDEWATPEKAHRKHLCANCGHLWKPALVSTVGVEKLPEAK